MACCAAALVAARAQNMDLQTKKKQDNWQDFLSGKGSKKKSGFLTGARAPASRGDTAGVARHLLRS